MSTGRSPAASSRLVAGGWPRPARHGGRRSLQEVPARPAGGDALRRPRRLLRPLPGRGRGARRRERLGQVDRGEAPRRPGAAELGDDPPRRRGRWRSRARGAFRALQERGAAGLPGPVRLAQPGAHRRATTSTRPVRLHRHLEGRGGSRPSSARSSSRCG